VAKKTRTPPPPRPVQAPRRRDTRAPVGGDERRRRLLLYGLAGSGVLALAIVVLVIVLTSGGGGSGALAKTMRAAGCTLKTYPSQGQRHVALNYKFKYNSFPPTSGPHYFQPLLWGVYDAPVRQIQEVHNLEHGGIVIQYGSKVPRSTVDELTSFYQSDANALILAPLPALGNKIALGAWTHLATCTSFDEKAFKAFRDEYRYHGPEHFPPSDLEPGE
jgi:Protein of unknown function (DUF3105)